MGVPNAELLQHAGDVPGRAEFAAFDEMHSPLLPPELAGEILHRRTMEDQLLAVEPILRHQQRFLDQHADFRTRAG